MSQCVCLFILPAVIWSTPVQFAEAQRRSHRQTFRGVPLASKCMEPKIGLIGSDQTIFSSILDLSWWCWQTCFFFSHGVLVCTCIHAFVVECITYCFPLFNCTCRFQVCSLDESFDQLFSPLSEIFQTAPGHGSLYWNYALSIGYVYYNANTAHWNLKYIVQNVISVLGNKTVVQFSRELTGFTNHEMILMWYLGNQAISWTHWYSFALCDRCQLVLRISMAQLSLSRTHDLWTSMVRLLCMSGLEALLQTSGENFISIAPFEYIYQEIWWWCVRTWLLKQEHSLWGRLYRQRVCSLYGTAALTRHAITASRIPKPQILHTHTHTL